MGASPPSGRDNTSSLAFFHRHPELIFSTAFSELFHSQLDIWFNIIKVGDHLFIPDLEELGPELGLDLSAYAIARHYEVCGFCEILELRGHGELRGLCYVCASGKLEQLEEFNERRLAKKELQRSFDDFKKNPMLEIFKILWSIHTWTHDHIRRIKRKIKSVAQDFVKDTVQLFCPAPVQEMTGSELDFRCHLETACEEADHTVCFRYPDKPGTPDGRPAPETLASRNFAAFYQSLTKDELDRGKPEYLSPGPTCHLHTLYAQKVNEYNGWQVVTAKQSTAYVGLFEVPFACARMRRDIDSFNSPYQSSSNSSRVDAAISTCKTIEAPAEADAQPGANLYDWLRLLFLFLRDNRSLIRANLNTLALVIIAVCLVKICLRD